MLFTLPPADIGSASVVLSEMNARAQLAAIHWIASKEYLLSAYPSEPKYQIFGSPTRSLTAVEEQMVWKSLFDSVETLYTL
jgi:hypothetical protein